MITLVNGKGEQINGFQFLDWNEADMDRFGYSDIFEYYATDDYDVYTGYDTENIDKWPIFGA